MSIILCSALLTPTTLTLPSANRQEERMRTIIDILVEKTGVDPSDPHYREFFNLDTRGTGEITSTAPATIRNIQDDQGQQSAETPQSGVVLSNGVPSITGHTRPAADDEDVESGLHL